jgi:propionyl-CoA carboxylase beta chain
MEALEARRAEQKRLGNQDKVIERHRDGRMTARERVDVFFDVDTFQEMGAFAHHHAKDFGMDRKRMPGDGVITGVGQVDGQAVAMCSQDFMVNGGTLGQVHADKIVDAIIYAGKTGIPVVTINDSGGARIQEGVDALTGYSRVFRQNVLMSGVVPQIAVIAGPCAGGAAYSPALMDFVVMTKRHAQLFITGPEVIRAVTGQQCSAEEVGGALMHASVSGNVHFVAEDDADALRIVKKLLSYLPPNNLRDPPHAPSKSIDLTPDARLDALVPSDPKTPLDMRAAIDAIFDVDSFFEVHALFAKNILVGFARLDGIVVGVVANQPLFKAGTLDIDAADKAARFIQFCDAFNIPLISLMDVPGFLPGLSQERGGIIRHGSKMLFAWASATVPKISLILRKAYGGAYIAMDSKAMGADLVFAWPSAEIAVLGAEGAINILFRNELKQAADPKARAAEIAVDYRQKFASPWQAAESNQLTDVIEPSRSRAVLSLALRNTLNKREARPAKKHGNIAL